MKTLFYSFFLSGLILSCGTQKIADYKSNSVEIDSTAAESDLDSMINPYRLSMEEEMNKVIGFAGNALEKFAPESPLGNFAADAAYEAGLEYGLKTTDIGSDKLKKSLCLLNFGGLRAPINKGSITVGNIYELMPFDNIVTLVQISGDKMKELCDYLYEHNGQPVSNATFDLKNDDYKVTIGGEPYRFDEDVVIITSDYLASGGDHMDFFKEPIKKWDSGIFLRDVFIDYVKVKRDLGDYPNEGRMKITKE
ncbi:5'-nucleotidase C-terminal domain-containing protein [Paracrocinitomix mangrovi]|uniref:5'-nucleotidase C-terminal domain-containing protein n=1 Tax=Paracrocinitomix mangrovi TaxID=2862509 RepID=UPI001C8E63D2|nr:5'-nucleotidase C-terminal domain-containing protein [Paracrocinitomix mangrovi]UKN02098.1 5'-nucleotidase C-terminal domain-containing protein [Paracrocinitomix mangrovi]